MAQYHVQNRIPEAIDCIIFRFDGKDIKLLPVKRGFKPEKDNWSLMRGVLHPSETLDEAANTILEILY
jgi:ADP-ribose pyrophosphatase YjhB (NUDIX family)